VANRVGGEPAGGDDAAVAGLPFAAFVVLEALLAPLALLLGWAMGQPPLADFAWDDSAVSAGLLATVPMLGLLAAGLRWPVGPLARIKAFFDDELAPLLRGCGWPDLALVSLAAGVGEEMLFRGVIQASVTRAFGVPAGLAGASLLFGLLHPISLPYALLAGALGAYLGALWLLTGNLLAPMVAHAVYDFVALLILLSRDEVGDEGS
jgi:membrane protease YdiL (CAAX protease family)